MGCRGNGCRPWWPAFWREGEAAFEPRSRRPHSSPRRTSDAAEDAIVELRKELAQAGHDAGAETIAWHLRQRNGSSPSVATIWRVLSRRGFVLPQPHKRRGGSRRPRRVLPDPIMAGSSHGRQVLRSSGVRARSGLWTARPHGGRPPPTRSPTAGPPSNRHASSCGTSPTLASHRQVSCPPVPCVRCRPCRPDVVSTFYLLTAILK
jgi:Homeodomain-like domain